MFLAICCGCRHTPEKGAQVRTIPRTEHFSHAVADSSCYIHTAGQHQQDTTLIRVQLRPDSVVGTMIYQPWQKDSRRGSLLGIRRADSILAEWNYRQEGQRSHKTLRFTVEGDTLFWLNAADEGIRDNSGAINPIKLYKTVCP